MNNNETIDCLSIGISMLHTQSKTKLYDMRETQKYGCDNWTFCMKWSLVTGNTYNKDDKGFLWLHVIWIYVLRMIADYCNDDNYNNAN